MAENNPVEMLLGEDNLRDASRTYAEIDTQLTHPGRTDIIAQIERIQAVQIMALQRESVIDDAAADAILRAIDVVHMAFQSGSQSVWENISSLDSRIDTALPTGIAGASALGRTRSETIATAVRMQWRRAVAEIASASLDLRSALHHLASAHTVTVMAAFADRKAIVPTTLAHFLGGVIGPLESSWQRFPPAIDRVDRSPFGAGLMVAEVFSAEREHTAKLLGFDSVIENTFDAASAVEDTVEALEAIAAQAAIIRRFANELLTWIRTDPTSFFIDERWEAMPEPAHPAHNVSTRLEYLNQQALRAESSLRTAIDTLRYQPYGPIGTNWDSIVPAVDSAMSLGLETITNATAAVQEAIIINRAYLANRAGRLYTTAADLAAFLMEDQGLNPADAQKIAGLSVTRLKEASLEAAQITPDIIDAGAVMVIGQELKVEMETLGRYIAPRRYVERRDVLGSAKADRTRDWLENVAAGIKKDRADLLVRTDRWHHADGVVHARIAESAQSREN